MNNLPECAERLNLTFPIWAPGVGGMLHPLHDARDKFLVAGVRQVWGPLQPDQIAFVNFVNFVVIGGTFIEGPAEAGPYA